MRQAVATSAVAFRGYNVTNLGRTPELLQHAQFGPVLAQILSDVSELSSDALHKSVDLVGRVRSKTESSLGTFQEDVALIVAVEMAHLELMREFFEIDLSLVKFTCGYSLGEIASLIFGGVYRLTDLLPSILNLAGECADLAQGVVMGIVFSRGQALDLHAIEKLCVEINQLGAGVISISSYLSPNSVLLLGQGKTVEEFGLRMKSVFDKSVHLRTHSGEWPPLHTPILWQRAIPNRAAHLMLSLRGGLTAPKPRVLSMVTGTYAYTDLNSRSILMQWIDHPQRLWDAVIEMLVSGVETIFHLGPEPNLIPATFKRLSDNVAVLMKDRSFNSMGRRAVSEMARRPWLRSMLNSRAQLLRAPFLTHVVLEDWLLSTPAKVRTS